LSGKDRCPRSIDGKKRSGEACGINAVETMESRDSMKKSVTSRHNGMHPTLGKLYVEEEIYNESSASPIKFQKNKGGEEQEA
jgi:hypothetical protein